jgi:hypothetical protein
MASEVHACLGTVQRQSAVACALAPKGIEKRWAKQYILDREGGESLSGLYLLLYCR